MVEKKKRERCQGSRRQFRGNAYGTFKCTRKATGIVETHVGFTQHHYVCDDPQCFGSVTGGYPAEFRSIR